jgi:hypothetical protein
MNMAWLDHIAWKWLLLLAVWMAVAPITPEPHLVEKLRMLSQGSLTRPMDIFDLLFHLAPLGLVALKYRHDKRRPKA